MESDIQAMWSELGNSPYSMIHWHWLNDMSLEPRSDKGPWEGTFFSEVVSKKKYG